MFVEVEDLLGTKFYINPNHIVSIVPFNDRDQLQVNCVEGSYYVVKSKYFDKLINPIITD